MQSWVAVEATLVSVDIDVRHGGVPRWSNTYKLNAQYRYYYNDQIYVGERVGIQDRSYDSFGNWHRDTHDAMLKIHPLRVWVNPEEPTEAIVDRTLRWGLFSFSLIIVMAFGGLGAAGFVAVYGNDVAPRDQVTHDLIKPDWRKSHICSNTQLWGLWYTFTVIFLFCVWMTAQILITWESSNPYALAVLIFPLATLPFFTKLVRTTSAWRLLGNMPLHVYSTPATLGKEINGTIYLRRCLPAEAMTGASLRCIAKQRHTFGRLTRTEQRIIWSEQHLLQCDEMLDSSELKFAFLLPEFIPGLTGKEVVWKLLIKIKCDAPRIDHTRVYTIPVAN